MTVSVRFENRDFEPYPHEHWESLEVVKYSKAAIGGSKKAVINAFGSREDIWEFVEMLRCPVYIMDTQRAMDAWVGYINRVTIYDEGVSWSVSLDQMANKIAIAYSYNFQRFTTAWASNTESQSLYGVKELLLTAREKSTSTAETLRNKELSKRKYPPVEPAFGKRKESRLRARIDAKGWFNTLGWKYYSQDEGSETYEDFGQGQREIGEDDRPTAAQGFQLSSASGWTATSIWLRVKKVGAPADNFQVALWNDDGGGLPNAQIEACEVLAGGNITTSYAWYEFALDSAQALALATQYWIHASRSGGVDADNYYMIDANTGQGYANGNLFIKPAGAWYDKNMDALFRVVGESDIADQITSIVTDSEFLEGTYFRLGESGVDSKTFRAGDQTALYEMRELLKIGRGSNFRYVAHVTSERLLEVDTEDSTGDILPWSMDKKGTIRNRYGMIIPPQNCTVARWLNMIDFIPSTTNISKLVNPSPLYVEEAEYDTVRGYRIMKTRAGVSAAESLTRGISIG